MGIWGGGKPLKIEKVLCKSLVRKSHPSVFAWMDYSLNPYQGCWHDCRYCDGKSERYHMHEDFGERILVKENAPELLLRFLRSKGCASKSDPHTGSLFGEPDERKAPFVLFLGGGVCDVYQPAEEKAGMTRRLLQISYDHGVPVSILTKNTLVLRDLDLLSRINGETSAGVHFSITLAEDEVRSVFEPRASPSLERFQAIRKFRESGIRSGVYFLPILPFIGDTPENRGNIFSNARSSGAQFVYSGGLTLKPGRNKAEFLTALETIRPELLSRYRRLYGNEDPFGSPDSAACRDLGVGNPEVAGFRDSVESGLDYFPARFIPAGRHRANLRISEVFQKTAFLERAVFHNHSRARSFSRTAFSLEDLEEDVVTLPKSRLDEYLPGEMGDLARELFSADRSPAFEALEKKAFESVGGGKTRRRTS